MDKFAHAGASLADFALRKPVTIGLCFLSMLLFGIMAGRLLPLEKFPGIDIPQLMVQIPYNDATPAEIERMITRPVEEAIATMSGIKELRATSYEDKAEISVEFAWDANIKAKSIEAREKIDAISHLLPEDVERILVYKFNTTDMPIFQLRVSSDRDLSSAYDLLDRNLKRVIERVPGVSKVELYGVMKKQIVIRLNPQRLTSLHIDPQLLSQRLNKANFSMTAGSFYTANNKITVNPQGEFTDINDINQLLIQPGIRLQDIASIAYELPERDEGRHLDRSYAVGFNIYRESGSNLVEVSERVMKVIQQANDDPAFNGINLYVMDDVADSVTSSLNDLIISGLIGALLSVAVLYLFLRQMTTTLLVVLSVPFSICITLGVMYLLGYSLNILSLMGLMLAVGMLVDNAVVITESIFQQRAIHSNAIEATKAGVARVSLAVIAGTATTAIVFLPNIVGVKIDITIFLEHVAIAICISLFASLLIAQTLIPLLASRVKLPKHQQTGTPTYIRYYGNALAWTLGNKGKTSVIALALLASTIIPMGAVTSDEENDSNNRVWLNYHMTENYTLDEVEKTVDKMEDYLYKNKEKFNIKQVYTYFTPGYAISGITLIDKPLLPIATIKAMIKEDMPSLVRARPSFRMDEGNGGGIRITLLGESSSELQILADDVIAILAKVQGLTDVNADVGSKRQELQIRIDPAKAFTLGLNSQDIASLIATALRGNNLRTFRYGEAGEIAIKMMYGESVQQSLDALRNINLSVNKGQVITLDMVADITLAPQLAQINRYYRQTALSIGANLDADTTLEQARERITAVMAYTNFPTGYSWTLDGSFTRQDEASAVMQMNMILAVCMIYVVMAALFESLLLPTAVITSLLFSFTGVFWAFLLTGTSISIMGMIGMLILMGIVVNNGIVLVDRINQLMDQGASLTKAVVDGCQSRIRPILMTVATTILGLLPLAMGSTQVGGDGPAYAPMAIAIIGGLIFSTLTSLFLIPLTYILLLKLRYNTAQVIARSRAKVDQVIKLN
jgi:multidrug efflux pump subunit AcrB